MSVEVDSSGVGIVGGEGALSAEAWLRRLGDTGAIY